MNAEAHIMRKWLRENGHDVKNTGRIAKRLQDIFYAANPQYSQGTVVFVDETQTVQDMAAPAQASPPRLRRGKMQQQVLGGSVLSYDTVAQTLASYGGSSAGGPPDAEDADNRLRIDMYYPDPLTPSDDVRTLYVSLMA